jgi:hypothetical protein
MDMNRLDLPRSLTIL